MFVRAANPIWYMVDHIGQPLNDEYYAFFLTNTLPYVPQNVYRDPQGMTVWTGDIVQFSPAGTLPDNLYFDPNLVYRIEIRHGNTQADQLIWEINNFVPGGGGGNDNNTLSILSNENQITNPQFSIISFVSPITITVAGTYDIAPGWELVLTGTGTTTLTQNILTGSQNIINNPPFSLRVNNNGWTEAYLRQRFNHNGAIWANGAVTMSITARAQTSPQEVTLIYAPSAPGVSQVVATGELGTGDYEVLDGAVDLPPSVNSGLSSVAYVDMIIQLPPTGIVDISNVQVIGQADPLPSDFDPDTDIPHFQQETEERYVDHMFNVYAQELIKKPKESLLVGWNFSLNPYQFVTSALTLKASMIQYVADQTILYQETPGNLLTGQADIAQRLGFELLATAGGGTTRFCLIQYIDPSTIRPYWSYVLSSLVRARIFTSHGTQCHIKMRLIYRASLPPAISNTEPIVSLLPGADPVFAAGWTEIKPLNDPAYLLLNAYDSSEGANNSYPGYSFDQFQLPNDSNANMTLGIVLYTMDELNSSAGTEDSIVIDKVSLVPNKYAVDAPPETFDEAFRKCQFYYEKSWQYNVLPGTATNNGALIVRLDTNSTGGASVLHFGTFEINYAQTKRAIPTTTIYSNVSGTAGQISGTILRNSTTPAPLLGTNPQDYTWALYFGYGNTSFDRITSSCNDTSVSKMTVNPGAAGDEYFLTFHYTADARLGV